MVRRKAIVVAAAVMMVCIPVWGAEDAAKTNNRENTHQNVDDVTAEAAVVKKDAVFELIPDLYVNWQKMKQDLSKKAGVDFAIENTTIYQHTTGGIDANSAAEDTLTLSATWAIFRDANGIDKAGVGFQGELRGNPTSDEFTDMTHDIGSLWSPNDSTSDDYNRINQLWWGQKMFEGRFAYIIGKLDPTSYVNGNRFAASGNTQFFGQPFATNPARAFPDNGLGAEARVMITKQWYVTGVVSDGNANSNYSPFKTIEGCWFEALETGVKLNIDGLGEGNYRITGWHRDVLEGETGNGWALSFDQDLGDTFGAFFRYGGNDGNIIPVEHIVSGGISLQQPFGRKNDQAGIGLSWTRPSDHDLNDEYSSEIYYRLQMTQFVEFSLSAQAIFDPSAGNQNTVGVFGARVRVLL